jgi:soluble lytic murein transglycosylase
LLSPLPVSAQSTSSKSKTQKKTTATKKPVKKKKSAARKSAERKRAISAAEAARARRLKRAFVASSDLKPMAKQLLEQRSKAAYSGVERYAKQHQDSDAGALAWLLLGHARLSDKDPDYDKAVEALKNAKPHAGGLSDYVDFLLATAYRGKGSHRDVVIALDGFARRHPDSLLARDASLVLAGAYLETAAYEDAVNVLLPQRTPMRADVELALGKAYFAQGAKAEGLEAVRRVYYQLPLSPQADEAGTLLRKNAGVGEYASVDLRRTRADALSRGRAYVQAASEYRQLLAEAPSSKLQLALANALDKIGRDDEAKQILAAIDLNTTDVETKSRTLYLRAEIARSEKDDAAQEAFLNQLLGMAPYSGWLQEALFSMGNKYLLRRELAKAAEYYDQVAHRFPKDKGASAHWKSAWLRYRLKDWATAKRQFEEQISLFPWSAEVPNALYWRGRLAEQDADVATARAYYSRLNERFPNYYYALNARERMAQLGRGEEARVALLDKVPAATLPRVPETASDMDNARLQKSRLLSNAALYEFAIIELQAAADDTENTWAPAELAKLHEEAGKYHAALQTLKRAIPAYLSLDLSTVPRYVAEGLFPRPYWEALEKYATSNGLDPYLVASLIRQESEFNPNAVSRANAYGLMQLLPEVGKQVAKQVKLKPYSTATLLEPVPNIQLGTKYFRQMVDENGGKVEYALAAYNAGGHRVTDWLSGDEFRDMPEFVESIPFTETREYVQAIVRNVSVYRQLYGSRTTAAATSP